VSRTRLPLAAVLVCLFLLDPSRRAWGERNPAKVLTLEQALAMAKRANRNLVAERARLEQAQTNLEQAWSLLFPTVAAQGRYARNNVAFKFPIGSGSNGGPPQVINIQPYDQLDASISFSAPLLAPAAYLGLSAVKASTRSSEANYETSEVSVLFAVAQAYHAAAIADEVLAARTSNLEVAHATLSSAETRFATGNVTKVDLDRAGLALVQAEQTVREARFGQAQSYRALATLVQADFGFQVEAVAPQTPDPRTGADDLTMVLRLRPELRAIELAARASLEWKRAYAWRWAPSLSAFGSARIFNYDNFALDHHAWAVGAQLDWTLFDGGGRDAQRHLAAAQARELEARAEALRESIRDDLANAQAWLETKRQASAAAVQSVSLAVEALDLVRTQYEAGSVAQLDLLQAQDRLVAAKESLAQAHFEVAIADLNLRRIAGRFPGSSGPGQ
jgi:outer membrane protein TolC